MTLRCAMLLLAATLFTGCAAQQYAEPEAANGAGDVLLTDSAVPDAEAANVAQAVELAQALGLDQMVNAVDIREDDYRIGPSDELEVEFFQIKELNTTERVNARGYIRLPLIGSVQVSGLTAYEVEDMLTERYTEGYLQDPQIYVNITNYASQRVTLLGNVKTPGIYPLTGPTSLLKAIALAGGTDDLANEKNVVVFRANDNGEVIGYMANFKNIQAGLAPDPEIIGNDRIVVDASASKSFIKGLTNTLRGFVFFAPF